MSSESDSDDKVDVQVVLEAQSIDSSEEPPMTQWSSLILENIFKQSRMVCRENGKPYVVGSGEICTKFLPMSASSMFRHSYYKYPAVLDPGIDDALFKPIAKVFYAIDGQDRYMDICKEMEIPPIKLFHRQLLTDTVDLKYYCVSTSAVRAMTVALEYNPHVKRVDLTDNFLELDACYHLGHMMVSNATINEMILTGCKIRAMGALRLLNGLITNTSLTRLYLNKNQLGDEGMQVVADAVASGIGVLELFLSYNGITSKSLQYFADMLEFRNKLVTIDLSWNNFCSPLGFCVLMDRLVDNQRLEELHLSFCSLSGPRIGHALQNIILAPNLRVLDLSNNALKDDPLAPLIENLSIATKLLTLNLSYNPLSPRGALSLLQKMRMKTVTLQNLLMDNVFVTREFIILLRKVKKLKFRKQSVVTYGGVITTFVPVGPDPRELVLNRADYVMKHHRTKRHHHPPDIALVFMEMGKTADFIKDEVLPDEIKKHHAHLDSMLLDSLIAAFPGPQTRKYKTLNLKSLVDYIHRKWPERKLPPTPPPEPEPEPPPPPPPPEPKKSKSKVGAVKSRSKTNKSDKNV